MLFFGSTIAIIIRVLLNVTITRMVYLPNTDLENVTESKSVCLAPAWSSVSTDAVADESVSIFVVVIVVVVDLFRFV